VARLPAAADEAAPVLLAALSPGGVMVVQPVAARARDAGAGTGEAGADEAGAVLEVRGPEPMATPVAGNGPPAVHLIAGVSEGARSGSMNLVRRMRAELPGRGFALSCEPGAETIPATSLAEAAAWREMHARRLRQAWSARRPRLVHCELLSAYALLAQEVAGELGIPVVTAWHVVPAYGQGADERARLERIALAFHRRSALTLAPTPAAAQWLSARGIRNRVAPYGVDAGVFRPGRRDRALRARWGAGDDTPVVLHAGRLIPEKDPAMVAAALAAAQARGAAVGVVAGEGPARAELERALPRETVFTGLISGDELAATFASADIFVFPGVHDLSSQAELEAMASGLALVACARPHGDPILQDGVTAVAVPLARRSEYPALVAGLAADLPRARRIGAAARAAAAGRTWERWLDEIAAGWSEVIGETGGLPMTGEGSAVAADRSELRR
jgi:glycosyltransferase involved in cell wall biosynthesis